MLCVPRKKRYLFAGEIRESFTEKIASDLGHGDMENFNSMNVGVRIIPVKGLLCIKV